jgi:hypothetical protein
LDIENLLYRLNNLVGTGFVRTPTRHAPPRLAGCS